MQELKLMREIKLNELTKKQKGRLLGLYRAFNKEYGYTGSHLNALKYLSFVIYFQNKKPIAFSSYDIDKNLKRIKKSYTFVSKKYRGHGIGGKLMKHFVEKYPEYEIHTIARCFLGNFLENLGFEFCSTIRVENGYKQYVRNGKH